MPFFIELESLADLINVLQEQIEGRLTGGTIDFSGTYTIIIRLALIYFMSSLFMFVQQYTSAGLSQKLICRLREQLNSKLSRLPLSYYDKNTKGQVISKMINDIENVSSSLQSSIVTIITSIVQVIGSLVMMLSTGNMWMTLVAICLVPISGTVSYQISKISKKWFRRYWDRQA